MPNGVVKWFSADKGYGFIAPTDGGEDAFVHISDVQASGLLTLRTGDDVHFDRSTNSRNGKSKAVNLRMLYRNAPSGTLPARAYGADLEVYAELVETVGGT